MASVSSGNSSIFLPMTPSIRWMSSMSYWVTMVTDLPDRPARAVRPTRWM